MQQKRTVVGCFDHEGLHQVHKLTKTFVIRMSYYCSLLLYTWMFSKSSSYMHGKILSLLAVGVFVVSNPDPFCPLTMPMATVGGWVWVWETRVFVQTSLPRSKFVDWTSFSNQVQLSDVEILTPLKCFPQNKYFEIFGSPGTVLYKRKYWNIRTSSHCSGEQAL